MNSIEAQKTGSQNPNQTVLEPGLVAKRVILSELGVSEETLTRINSVADADLLIEYYNQKSAKNPVDDLKAKFANPGTKGAKGDDPFSASGALPKPDIQSGVGFQGDPLEVALNPLHPQNAIRRNAESRLAIIFDGHRWRVF